MSKTQKYWDDIEKKYGHLGDRVWCKECGRCFKSLGGHIKAHGLTRNEYKDKHRILRGLPLCSEDLSDIFSKTTIDLRKKGVLFTTETFLNSKKNLGMEQPLAARRGVADYHTNRPAAESTKKKMSEYAKNRPKHINKKIGQSLTKHFQKSQPLINCGNCGKEFHMISLKRKAN